MSEQVMFLSTEPKLNTVQFEIGFDIHTLGLRMLNACIRSRMPNGSEVRKRSEQEERQKKRVSS